MYGEAHQSVMDSSHLQTTPPKLEDLFGDTTQDSTLTHTYFSHGGLTGFSTNSAGSEVDDSSFESGSELAAAFNSHISTKDSSLGVTNAAAVCSENTKKLYNTVSADSGSHCKKVSDTFGQRTSIYRGVTRHRWTGRYEAHLWDNSCRREDQARKGRQVYLGGYDKEEKAARSYDLAALKYWGSTATTNFPISNYAKELDEMENMSRQEFIASLRRKSSGFSRGASIYRGVTRHHQQGRWQARIGRVAGNKDLYLGTFATEEEAAEAYDIAAIKFRGLNAVTNFEMSRYDVETINKSSLPVGGAAKRVKLSVDAEEKVPFTSSSIFEAPYGGSSNINFAAIPPVPNLPLGIPFVDGSVPFYHQSLFQHLHSSNPHASNAPGSISTPTSEFFMWPHQSY